MPCFDPQKGRFYTKIRSRPCCAGEGFFGGNIYGRVYYFDQIWNGARPVNPDNYKASAIAGASFWGFVVEYLD